MTTKKGEGRTGSVRLNRSLVSSSPWESREIGPRWIVLFRCKGCSVGIRNQISLTVAEEERKAKWAELRAPFSVEDEIVWEMKFQLILEGLESCFAK